MLRAILYKEGVNLKIMEHNFKYETTIADIRRENIYSSSSNEIPYLK